MVCELRQAQVAGRLRGVDLSLRAGVLMPVYLVALALAMVGVGLWTLLS